MPTNDEPRHPIRVVAQRTGLSPATLRAWERRYALVEPGRSDGGQRLYSDDDVERLRRLHALTEAGRPIGLVAGLSDAELSELEEEDRARRYVSASPTGPRRTEVSGPARVVAEALGRVGDLDAEGLEGVLRRGAVGLGARAFLEEVLTPLLHGVGAGWARGALGPAHEHLCTSVVQGVLAWLSEPVGAGASGPRLVVATLPGERHGLGAMIVAAAAAVEGWRVTQLGVDLPAADIAAAARALGARAVAVSVVNADARNATEAGLAELRRVLGPEVGLLVGGGAAARLRAEALPEGIERLQDLAALGEALARIA